MHWVGEQWSAGRHRLLVVWLVCLALGGISCSGDPVSPDDVSLSVRLQFAPEPLSADGLGAPQSTTSRSSTSAIETLSLSAWDPADKASGPLERAETSVRPGDTSYSVELTVRSGRDYVILVEAVGTPSDPNASDPSLLYAGWTDVSIGRLSRTAVVDITMIDLVPRPSVRPKGLGEYRLVWNAVHPDAIYEISVDGQGTPVRTTPSTQVEYPVVQGLSEGSSVTPAYQVRAVFGAEDFSLVGAWSAGAGEGIGACCFDDGGCQTLIESDCTSESGFYFGEDTTCEACLDLGACCLPGECRVVLPVDCETAAGEFLGAGSVCDPGICDRAACCLGEGLCEVVSDADCRARGGDPQSEAACEPDPCPSVVGACCLGDSGECAVLTEPQCQLQTGSFQGVGVLCDPTPCGPALAACCFVNGACQMLSEADCVAAQGVGQAPGSSCAPNPCPPPTPTGACCVPTGACTVFTASECDVGSGDYQGDDVPCTPELCRPPDPTGACCFDQTCTVQTATDCAAANSEYLGDDVPCTPKNPCADPPRLVCCFASTGSCSLLEEDACASAGGETRAGLSVCDPNPCPPPTGSCCFTDGSCQVVLSSECTQAGGDFRGVGTVCADPPCPPSTGACCTSEGECSVEIAVDCVAAGGLYLGSGTVCDPNPCVPVMGSCCFADGTCEVITSADCSARAGEYRGDDTLCEAPPCPPPVGACCTVDAECRITLEAECESAGDTYQGPATPCDPNPCPEPEPDRACCFEDGSCSLIDETDCASRGGVFRPTDTSCDPNPCPQPPPPTGACCASDGTCSVVTEADCTAGVYQGDDAACDPNPCPQLGACCLQGGLCTVTTAVGCARSGGEYLGDGTDCETSSCARPGACCLADDECVVRLEADCDTEGGSFLGQDIVCEPDPCPDTRPPDAVSILVEAVTATTVSLRWNASGDDGSVGSAERYDIRYSSRPPRNDPEGWFETATPFFDPIPPRPAGIREVKVVRPLDPNDIYYLAVRVYDEADNGSPLSNVVSARTPDDAVYGACCIPGTDCRNTTEANCEGDWYPELCEDCNECNRSGACCFYSGGCEIGSEAFCNKVQGTYLGDCTVCDPSPCEGVPPLDFFEATPNLYSNDLSWQLPDDLRADGVEVRYSFEGFPEVPGSGSPVPNGANGRFPVDEDFHGSFQHLDLSPFSEVYYAAFPYDEAFESYVYGSGSYDSALPDSVATLFHGDETYETGYAWRYAGVVSPDYGSFATSFSGPARVRGIFFDLTQSGGRATRTDTAVASRASSAAEVTSTTESSSPSSPGEGAATMNVFLWGDDDGVPGAVIDVAIDYNPGPVAEWPQMSRHHVLMNSYCSDSIVFVGFWGAWPGEDAAWFVGADLNGPAGGTTITKIAPGLGYPEEWQDVDVVWGNNTSALGIGVRLAPCVR